MTEKDVLAIVGASPHNTRDGWKPAFQCPRGLAIATQQIHVILTFSGMVPDLVVSGGAEGVDAIVEQEASTLAIPFHPYRPRSRYATWDSPGGFKERNEEIAQACTRLLRIACAHSQSYGSGWTADRAAALGRTVERLWIDRDGNVYNSDPKLSRRPRTRPARRPTRAEPLQLSFADDQPDGSGWTGQSKRWA